jgi:hypothetical protein
MAAPSPAGWYPDPSGSGHQRYWDGAAWGPIAPPAAPPAPMAPAGVIVTGPNHAVHAILSLLTFWMCGGWIWVWLIVALANNKRAQPVDAYGNPIPRPFSPYQQQHTSPGQAVKEFFTDESGEPDWLKIGIAAALLVAFVVVVFVLPAVLGPATP